MYGFCECKIPSGFVARQIPAVFANAKYQNNLLDTNSAQADQRAATKRPFCLVPREHETNCQSNLLGSSDDPSGSSHRYFAFGKNRTGISVSTDAFVKVFCLTAKTG
jgi:hypothetical protein